MKNLFLLLLLTVHSSCMETPLQRADNNFDVTVSSPAYTKDNPAILFDEGHHNFHTTTGLYRPFANLMVNDGYRLTTLKDVVTPGSLQPATVYVIANAAGTGELNDDHAFTDAECEIIKEWVHGGGSLLLIADHFPFGSAVQNLGDKFGIDFQKGMVEDSIHYDRQSKDYSSLEFSKANGLLGSHEITEGISRVLTFTGQSLKCKDSCFSFLRLSPFAFDLEPVSKVTRNGSDTRVEVNYRNPVPADGRSQGVALRFGKGKVIVLGEAAMLTAQKTRDDMPVGMNYNLDNKKLALNIMHWLSEKD